MIARSTVLLPAAGCVNKNQRDLTCTTCRQGAWRCRSHPPARLPRPGAASGSLRLRTDSAGPPSVPPAQDRAPRAEPETTCWSFSAR